jgi:hypothetical protein
MVAIVAFSAPVSSAALKHHSAAVHMFAAFVLPFAPEGERVISILAGIIEWRVPISAPITKAISAK